MKNEVTLNTKAQKRVLVLNEVIAGRLTAGEAAEMLGLSVRHTRRLLAAYRQQGAAVLVHGNRGRAPVNKLEENVAAEILRLAQEEYADYNDCHFTDELADRHQIAASGAITDCARPANGGHHGIAGAANGIRRPGCSCRWMAANTTGWKGAVPG